ncbi:MAG: DNA-3-methyladenine glycosylase [Thermoanaerobaculaceae bacterium]|nr:DNA-3-methyladenine glycosylase [Thermoanaerobaculaceae bacterium]MDI9622187.1 DNA-3-methyladenine glycosylase [Acidobacteriota bacterium]NLH12620.1 DNA-3-methyladenine glycosylase [Holophagae bacterium]HPW54910.1 DNA-3-methyladenine glycosylase [Thermoanaerobaculaceae bacterium]
MWSPLSDAAIEALAPLERGFYQRPTETVAEELLGKLLVRRLPEGLVALRLCEIEAYLGVDDPACHTFGGRRTPRTEVMWGEAGHLYVYFTYGMHFCANVVTSGPGEPEAALLRGGVVLAGVGLVERRRGRRDRRGWLDGPGRLCRGLGLGRAENGADLTVGGAIWLADDGVRVPSGSVVRGPRVGVAYAGEAAGWPLRFRVEPDGPVEARSRGAGAGAGRARPA